MATEIIYEYRDYGGFKVSNVVVFPDDPTQKDIDRIYSNLLDEEFFIPSQVGLVDLQNSLADGQPLGKNDHVEHTILNIGFTELDPTIGLLFTDFANIFSQTKWDVLKSMDELGLSNEEAVSYLAQFVK